MSITDTVIEQALLAAVRAPSVHNTQPWRFVVAAPFVEVHLDRERVLPVVDPAAREARISCGAAVFNLWLAVRAAGRGAVVDLLPDPDRPDLLAVLRMAGVRPATPEESTLAHTVARRATNRRPFTDRPVPPPHRAALVRAAEAEHAHLILLDTPKRLDTLATLLRRADHLQVEDPAFQRELRAWTEPDAAGGDRTEDGVPRSAGGPRPSVGSLLVPRQFHEDATAERPFEQDPFVVVLTTHGDTARDHLHAGLAMQRVLLSATVLGLSASFLSQPVEVPHTRAALRALLDVPGQPQTVLRIGYGHPVATTPRRPVAAVTTMRAEVPS
ncbi:Acg family FMN-binding oxidoreductase [Actinophytocola sp.]|uniref:Acg family FMN-binding oxidoreductase n=1 Tax=Actinophytocola sp. TaxID=1872138 RepID=UPI002D257873|nr:nitroreductase family protein [Actinophytocola sp.]HYQ63984.1 nitroreductase family protein [Actinophytocola sp.]